MPDVSHKRAPNPRMMISGSGDGRLTVGDIRDAIHDLDDIEMIFGSTYAGKNLLSYSFKWRGEKLLQMELNEEE